ncbi:DUF433 domain-containing protein [Halorarum halobium]|uniref:DUF433 domain-containing protein n=1 Tax=Halorarum halobium TaxID=3075121 RepID=UPI0028B0DE00|nr:DUF433 domain-containing protein [Halobaculum sp. XH14]
MTEIVRDDAHSDGAPTIDGTGIRVINVASAYVHSGYSPDEIVDFYPSLSLADVHSALAYYYDHVDEFDVESARNERDGEGGAGNEETPA